MLHDGRHACRRGRGGPRWVVLALGGARVHEVDMGIDHSRHYQQPGGIDAFGGARRGRAQDRDAPVLDVEMGALATRGG